MRAKGKLLWCLPLTVNLPWRVMLHACQTWKSTASRDPQHSGCVPSSMCMEDPGTVVARPCHQRGVDEKIWDASPIRDSVNPEAEICRPRTTIAWCQTCTCSHDLDTRIWPKNQRSTTDDLADVIYGRPTQNEPNLARCKESCQRSTPVEKSRRPMSRPEQEELSLSQ